MSRDVKAGLPADGKWSAIRHCRAGPFAAGSPSQKAVGAALSGRQEARRSRPCETGVAANLAFPKRVTR